MGNMISIGKGLLLTGCVAVAAVGVSLAARKPTPTTLELVKDYKTWKKANPEPVLLSTSLDLLCRGVMPEEHAYYETQNPHFDRTITVFVNPIGEKAMLKGGEFPAGSVIVKEKHSRTDGPVLMSTVMIKREKGYNPSCGDWEFAALDAAGTKTNGDGKLESCMKCHQDQAKQDFVYRTYVGAKQMWSPSGYRPSGYKWGG